ncbi:glycosyltransferase [Flavobacteriaceae bacterium AU392]|nr:glycosyltransferase [Flavobacteriaceae bacterium]RKM85905.1 glycosyltransferase [Flavobacteriaceae bacterium AU392]
MKTGIIIPCYNEGNRLNVEAFLKFIKYNEDYYLCFVNDGSKDNTLEVLADMKDRFSSRISIIDVKKNAGKASAVRVGARYLFNKQDIDYIGFIDADLSTDFEDFKNLVYKLKNLNDVTLVYGSRGKEGGQIERNVFRNIFSKIVKMIVSLILGLSIKDTQCGAKVFKREIIPVAYNKRFLSRWLFDVEIFVRLKKYYGASEIMHKIYEQPLKKWIHMDDSKLGMKDALKIPLMLVNIWFSYNVLKTFDLTQDVTPVVSLNKFNLVNEEQQMVA